MTDEHSGLGGQSSDNDDLVEIDLNFESMRRFQAEFSPNLSKDGLFIDTGEPLDPGSVVRFRVILPEDFVFLEGTAVVEWRRGAEAVSEGPPGMALRFVTLSPQNEELVEQLVQDHIDAGGTPFDLVVRPEIEDFPTDALEGAPAEPEKAAAEAYRLTVRGTGPSLESEALQALQDAVPGADEPDQTEAGDESDPATDSGPEPDEDVDATHEFEIVAGGPDAHDEAVSDEQPAGESMGEAPDIDWTEPEKTGAGDPPDDPAAGDVQLGAGESPIEAAEAATDAEPESEPETEFEPEPEIEPEVEPEAEEPGNEGLPFTEPEFGDLHGPATEVEEVESSTDDADYDSSITDVLEVPEEFASGPEVIEEIEEDFGSRAFEVSLPDGEDEPDTTPVMPDEGGADVTVSNDDAPPSESRGRRFWPLGLGLILVLAVAAGFLRPYVQSWLEARGEKPALTASSEPAEAVDPAADPVRVAETDIAPKDEPVADGDEQAAHEMPAIDAQTPPESVVEAVAPEAGPEAAPEVVPTVRADAIESIEIEPGSGGTIVRILGNGTLGDGAVSMENLSSPPRILVRLRGIRSVFRPFTIEASTAEVTQARIGLHDDRRPPELWVVLDLTGPGAEIGGVDIRDERVEFVIAGR